MPGGVFHVGLLLGAKERRDVLVEHVVRRKSARLVWVACAADNILVLTPLRERAEAMAHRTRFPVNPRLAQFGSSLNRDDRITLAGPPPRTHAVSRRVHGRWHRSRLNRFSERTRKRRRRRDIGNVHGVRMVPPTGGVRWKARSEDRGANACLVVAVENTLLVEQAAMLIIHEAQRRWAWEVNKS